MNRVAQSVCRNHLLLWVAAVVLLFFKLGSTYPWQSEDRWLEIVREMMDSGNYLRPAINDQVYFDKPLLSYWLQALTATLLGGLDEWTLRIPGALAALVALWATVDLGRRLWSEQTGRAAGWILLTSLGFLQWARIAEADMENLAVTIVAVNWYWRRRDSTRFVDYLVFYLALAIGSQFKGLTAVVVPLLAVAPDMLAQSRWRKHLNPAHVLAVVIAAAIYIVPFLLATRSTGSEITTAGHSSGFGMVIRENIVRYFAPFDHTGPIYTYLEALPGFMFPWSFVLVAALAACGRKNFRQQENIAWVLWAFGLIFVFFSLSGSRRGYYILPILPYCALLSARFLRDASQVRLRKVAINLSLGLVVLSSVLQILVAIFWSTLEQRLHTPLPMEFKTLCLLVGISSLCVLSGAWWKYRGRSDNGIIAVTASAWMLWSGFFGWQQVAMDNYRSEIPFARDVKSLGGGLSAAQIVIYHRQPSGKLLYYSGLALPIQEVDNPMQLQQFLDSALYPKLVLVESRYREELPDWFRQHKPDVAETRFSWEKNTRDKMLAWRLDTDPVTPSSP